jgi:hypothetical protein
MSAAKLITCIAIGYVSGQVLMEILMIAAEWAGGAVVRGFAGILRLVMQQRRTAVSE